MANLLARLYASVAEAWPGPRPSPARTRLDRTPLRRLLLRHPWLTIPDEVKLMADWFDKQVTEPGLKRCNNSTFCVHYQLSSNFCSDNWMVDTRTPMHVKEKDFSLTLPAGEWTNHSTNESFDFRLGDHEQVIVVVHLPRKSLADQELLKTVVDLVKVRLASLQQHSGNACQFDAPRSDASPGKMQVFISGQDMRQHVLIHIGFFGVPERIVAVSYYDYSGSPGSDRFKSRGSLLFSSVSVT